MERMVEDKMNARAGTLIPFACCVVLMTTGWTQTAGRDEWKTYRSRDYGFKIEYPRTMTSYPNGPVRPPQESMFPICDDGTVACFEYNGHALDRTEIQAIGVSVNVLRDVTTEAGCARIETDSKPIQAWTIHGIPYHYAATGEAGLGSSRSLRVYRTLHQGVCFEVALVTARSDLSAQDLKDEGRAPANPRTLRKLDTAMERMLDSFTFIGPVSDGAGWTRFTGSPCGETFDYPDSTTVDSESPSALPVFNAWQISCVDRFTYDQRQYVVAAKENLPNGDAVMAWLDSTGLPRLEDMQAIAKNSVLTEYRDPDIVYLIHGASFYLVTVTDGSNHPLPIGSDGVLKHLLSSFQVR
jgi:hypothetical protein